MRNSKSIFYLLLLPPLMLPALGIAESQNTLVVSTPAAVPGSSGPLTASQSTGPSASISGTVEDTYSGVRKFTLGSDGSGRFATLNGATRVGLVFDTFQVFQSFLAAEFFTVVSSSTTCPSSGTYTWIKVRFRTPDATRNAMDASSTSEQVGGVLTYDSAATYDLTGSQHFNLAGPTLTSAAYNIDRLSSGCTSGNFKTKGVGTTIWDTYGTIFFGDENFVTISNHGNPIVTIGAPQVTLSASDFSSLASEVFTGIYTHFKDVNVQNKKNVFFYPDAAGTTYTIRESSDLADPFSYTALGSLTCTSRNSPTNGFCSGTLTLSGVSGSGKAVCQLSSPATRMLLACAMQYPDRNSEFVSFIGTTSPRSVLATLVPNVAVSSVAVPAQPEELTVTVRNMTGRRISSMGPPASSGERPQAPFSYLGGNYPGTGGTCGSALNGYSSCTVKLAYMPSGASATVQTFRQEYNNGVSTVQGTGNARGVAALSNIVISGPATGYSDTTKSYTAVATFANASTQSVTSIVSWFSSGGNVAKIDSNGVATLGGSGSTSISAQLGNTTSNSLDLSVSQGPSNIDTSSSVLATASSHQRKMIYDSVHSLYWSFYYTGATIEMARSSNGIDWTPSGVVLTNTSDFSVSYKAISSAGLVFLAHRSGDDVVMRVGVAGSSLITFDSERLLFDGTTGDSYSLPSVSVSSDDRVWVAARRERKDRADQHQAFVRRSTSAATSTVSAFDTAVPVGAPNPNIDALVLVPQGTGLMLLSKGKYPSLSAYSYNGTLWTDANTGGPKTWFQSGSGLTGSVNAAVVHGSNLVVGGSFLDAGGNSLADRIAVWNGTSWQALGSGLSGTVNALYSSGSNLFIGGNFTDAGGNTSGDRVVRWDGSSYVPIGTGVNNEVFAIAELGNDLWIGGDFSNAGGNSSADQLAKWNGSAWVANGAFGSTVQALKVDGSNLYVGGQFTNGGGNTSCDRICRWNGSAWNSLGSGVGSNVYAITVFGGNVIIGGSFTDAGGNSLADRIASWNGSSWSALAGQSLNSSVRALGVSGGNLYLGGNFTDYGSNTNADRILMWTGSDFTPLSTGADDSVLAIASYNSELVIGGDFLRAGGTALAAGVAVYRNSMFSSMAAAEVPTILSMVSDGTNVYIGGSFSSISGNSSLSYIAKWNGSEFLAVGNGLNGAVRDMQMLGSNLYAVGEFTDAGGNASADRVALFNGSIWSALGTGISSDTVNAIAVESASNIFVGGNFLNAGGNASADRFARWNGSNWIALSSGVGDTVEDINVQGSLVYLAGAFTNAGGNRNADGIATWNGSAFAPVGNPGLTGTVHSMAWLGSSLVIGGSFSDVGGNANADNVAIYNGSSWISSGSALNGEVFSVIESGSNIYIGGNFTNAGGNADADYIARWNGTSYAAIDKGLNGSVTQLIWHQDGIHAVGSFTAASDGSYLVRSFGRYGASAADAASTGTGLSAISDASGNIHLAYLDASLNPNYRKYTSSWSAATALRGVATSSPSISIDSSSNLTVGWINGSDVEFKRYTAGTGAWDSSETDVPAVTSPAALSSLFSSPTTHPLLIWTSGSGSPYTIKGYRIP